MVEAVSLYPVEEVGGMREHLKDCIAIADRVSVLEARLCLFSHPSIPVSIGGSLLVVSLPWPRCCALRILIIPAREVEFRHCLDQR